MSESRINIDSIKRFSYLPDTEHVLKSNFQNFCTTWSPRIFEMLTDDRKKLYPITKIDTLVKQILHDYYVEKIDGEKIYTSDTINKKIKKLTKLENANFKESIDILNKLKVKVN